MTANVDAKTITVLSLGMDERKEALLRMAFRMHRALDIQLHAPHLPDPSLAIVDVDSPAGWSVWDELQSRYPSLPALIVSAFPVDDAPAPVLPKPIRVETLFPAMQEVMSHRARPQHSAEKVVAHDNGSRHMAAPSVPASAGTQAPAHPARPAHAPESPAKMPAAAANAKELPSVLPCYDPRLGLNGILIMAHRKRKNVALRVGTRTIMALFPSNEAAYLMVSDKELELLSQDAQLKPEVLILKPDSAHPEGGMRSLHSVLWQVAIWSARGRMPAGITSDSQLRLRHWPNLTRLAPIPNAMRMAAFWTRTPASPKLAMRMLGTETADLCNFLAACFATGILAHPKGITPEQPAARTQHEHPLPAEPTTAKRGLLSRLLAKITSR